MSVAPATSRLPSGASRQSRNASSSVSGIRYWSQVSIGYAPIVSCSEPVRAPRAARVVHRRSNTLFSSHSGRETTSRLRELLVLGRGVESALDLNDVVLVQPVHFDDGAWRIRPIAPKLLLNLVDERTMPEHVGDEHHEAHCILQCRAFRRGDQFHILERLADALLIALHQRVGCGVDAPHTCNENE